jgi:MFS family permease
LCAALTFSSFLLLPAGKITAWISLLVITFSEMFAMPLMQTFVSKRGNEHNRASYLATYSMAWGLAQALGPYTGTWIVEHYNFSYLFVIIMTFCMASFIGFVWVQKKLN